MGAIDEISGDGKGARLAGASASTADQLAAARKFLTDHQADDLIPMILGPDQQEGEPQ